MKFELTILGSNSAVPAYGRHPTAQILNINDSYYLIDCGEGTQMRLAHFQLKTSKIDHIFISHLHGDHYYGLIGMITTYNLMGRKNPLHVYSVIGLKELIDIQLAYANTQLSYELIFHTIDDDEPKLIMENDDLQVTSIPLIHRVPCLGFVYKEKRHPRHLRKDKIEEYNISYADRHNIKEGNDLLLENGNVIPNQELTSEADKSRSYAYITDTSYNEEIIPFIKNANLLYHEATFDSASFERAKETYHSTTRQAATIAQNANVDMLLIGHFSARYKELQHLLDEASIVFKNTCLATEGTVFSINKNQEISVRDIALKIETS